MVASAPKTALKNTPNSQMAGLNTTLPVPTTISAPIPKKLKGTLISLGPQTNKEVHSRKFDFVLTQQMASTKHSKEVTQPKQKKLQASMAKMKSNKLRIENRTKNKSFEVVTQPKTLDVSQVEFEPVNSNKESGKSKKMNTTQVFGGSNSSKTMRD